MGEDDRGRRVVESLGKECEERHADDDGGQEEGNGDECAHEGVTGKVEARQHPGDRKRDGEAEQCARQCLPQRERQCCADRGMGQHVGDRSEGFDAAHERDRRDDGKDDDERNGEDRERRGRATIGMVVVRNRQRAVSIHRAIASGSPRSRLASSAEGSPA